MNGPRFTSKFAPELERYLAFKENMGFHGATRVWYLRNFDRYCTERNLDNLDRATVEGWVVWRLPSHQEGSRSWISCIRDFGRWEHATGNVDAYVLSDRWRVGNVRPQPYLLTNEEIVRFFDAAAQLVIRSPWRWQGSAFFTLMHSCGLRTGEVLGLTPEDVNLGEGTITIRWAKGNRSRQLPLTGQVIDVLAECDRTSREIFGADRTAFFISTFGTPVRREAITDAFHRIWDQAGLPHPIYGKQPRPYDFRHHFAYANIERWMAEGTDVNAMLPYLARYMGHGSLDSTFYYIHTSPDFMNGYADIVREGQGILPEVGFE
ncbi:tyrosine-type recombinase/integrase [Paeniglutamicibacter antarcticus]|uniref:Tyrosine-type recombinase/integrase n=1 Tax=Paeniglutamicibacter antarcticus TaxID=494023 RepID=A0ABP9TLE2_9MICC